MAGKAPKETGAKSLAEMTPEIGVANKGDADSEAITERERLERVRKNPPAKGAVRPTFELPKTDEMYIIKVIQDQRANSVEEAGQAVLNWVMQHEGDFEHTQSGRSQQGQLEVTLIFRMPTKHYKAFSEFYAGIQKLLKIN